VQQRPLIFASAVIKPLQAISAPFRGSYLDVFFADAVPQAATIFSGLAHSLPAIRPELR
jgi:hypothetical protein